jgi:biopolymer transport protein ExbB/TolQ
MLQSMIEGLAKIFREGGVFTYLIAAVSAIAVGLTLERCYYYLIRCRINAKSLLAQIMAFVREDKVAAARKLCTGSRTPLGQILESGLWHFEQGESEQEIQNAVDEVALRVLPLINKRVHYLSLFANISTLLGLLGTIQGLMGAFASLGAAEASQKATLLAAAIAEIMGTTFLGIVVAIPCMVVYSILGAKANSLIEEIDECTVRLLNFLFRQKRQ